MQKSDLILSMDPGRHKVGYALLSIEETILSQGIVTVQEFYSILCALHSQWKFTVIVCGDGTASEPLKQSFLSFATQNEVRVEWIDETYSSEEARKLYFELYPPKGFSSIIPRGLLHPPRDYDDVTAIVLAKRYLRAYKERANACQKA